MEAVQNPVQIEKRVPGRPFVPGDPRVDKSNLAQNRAIPDRVEPKPSRSEVLMAYRAVLANHPKRDVGGLEEAAREVLRKDKKGFLAKFEELERREAEARAEEAAAAKEQVAAAVVAERPLEDAGADRVVEAIDRVLTDALSAGGAGSP